MSNKEKATKISWLTLAFMAFSTVWGFGNITNGFVYLSLIHISEPTRP